MTCQQNEIISRFLTCGFTAANGHQSSSIQDSFRVGGQLALGITAPALRDGISSSFMELHLRTENNETLNERLSGLYVYCLTSAHYTIKY